MKKAFFNLPSPSPRPYSQAVKAGDYVFVSGTTGAVNPETGGKVSGIQGQTKQCLDNIKRVLAMAGSSLDEVVKCTVFIKNEADFAPMNEVYRTYFVKDLPARSTVVTGLVSPDMIIEIECIAYHPE
jgi:2-iminobutanoate/2-iminopropanoate deaminase